MASLSLQNTKVLDLSRVLAGPICTMMLGDLGADVIKVERPGHGDETREWGPPFDADGASAYYLAVNRNKLSIAADFRSDGALIRSLAAGADVVVENFLPGALARAGLSADDLLEANPKLVWCTITGFGATSSRPGYDFVVQAETGWMAITGEPGGEPMKAGVALADIIAGKDATIAILAALTGLARGNPVARRLTISLADSARAALINAAQNAMVSGTEATRWGNAHANLAPYQLFRARDRGIVIAVGSDVQWNACVSALGLRELAADTRLATNRGRLEHRARVVSAIQQAVSVRSASECAHVLDQAGVPNGLVKSVLEAIVEAGSASPRTGMPSSVGGSVRLAPPVLDQHGALIRDRGWGAFSGLNGGV